MIFFPKTYSVKKYAEGTRVKGRYVNGVRTTVSVVADAQPITGKELESLNIGRQELGKIKIYMDEQLRISDEGTKQNGDIFVWHGDDYEVIQQLPRDHLIPHNKYIGELRKEDANVGG